MAEKTASYIVLLLLISAFGQAQIRSYGISADYNLFNTKYDFKSLQGVYRAEVPLTIYQKPSSFGFGLNLDFNLYDSFFLSTRLAYQQYTLEFLDYENVFISDNGRPIPGVISQSLTTRFDLAGFELLIGYNFLNAIDMSIGSQFSTPIKTSYNQEEELISPPNFKLINSKGNSSGKINETNNILIMPTAKLALNWEKLSIKSWRFIPEARVSFNITNLIKNSVWNYTNLSFGIGINYFPQQRNLIVQRDTVYLRDTAKVFTFEPKDNTIRLLSSSINEESFKQDNVIRYTTTITEKYELLLPKHQSILNGELKTTFVSSDGSEKSNWQIIYTKKINNFYQPIEKSLKKKNDFMIIHDTNSTLDLPSIRFYPQILSEAGLSNWVINISKDKKILKTIKGDNDPPKFIDLSLDSIKINYKKPTRLNYELILTDIDGLSVKTATGIINITDKSKSETQNGSNYLLLNLKNQSSENLIQIISKLKKELKTVTFEILSTSAFNNPDKEKIDRIFFPEKPTTTIIEAREYNTLLRNIPNSRDYILIKIIR
jgi:hypothetical protein